MSWIAWIHKVQQALHECAESIRRSEERKRNKQMPVNNPTEVRAIVSFDDKTVRDAETQAEKDRRVQNSIKKAAWSAFVAASIYSLISAYQSCELRKATVSAETQARISKAQLMLQLPGDPSFIVDSIGLYRGFDRPFADVTLRNDGGGVILDATATIDITFGGAPPRHPYAPPAANFHILDDTILHSTSGIGQSPRQYGTPISKQDAERLIASGARVYVWGIAKYRTFNNADPPPVEFCRYTFAKDVLTLKAYESQAQIEKGGAGPGYGFYRPFKDCDEK